MFGKAEKQSSPNRPVCAALADQLGVNTNKQVRKPVVTVVGLQVHSSSSRRGPHTDTGGGSVITSTHGRLPIEPPIWPS